MRGLGPMVNVLAVIATAFGVAASLGMGALQINSGLATVVGMPVGRRDAATRGIHRTAGTLVGAALYLVLAFLPLPVWALGVVLGLLQFAIELVVVRHYALALVFITPLVLLIIGAATGDAASIPLAFERVVDTLVGAAIGTAAALAVRLRLD